MDTERGADARHFSGGDSMAGAELGFETNTCTIISDSCPFRPTCCAGRFARTPGAALLFLHRGAKSAISASAISTGLGSSGVKNRSPSSLSPFPTRSYRVSNPFWIAMPSDVPVLLGTPELLNSYRIRAFPTVYVLNESGNIDGSTVGYSSTLGLWWRTL